MRGYGIMSTIALEQRRGSVIGASIWMVVLSLLLFWLPVVGPLIAGVVGGRKAGSVGGAFLAEMLPAIAIAFVIVVLATLVGLPFVGFVGATAFIFGFAIHGIPLLIGALIGAIL